MAPHVIVSYDGTANDHDALALGRRFHDLGSPLTLAYVRHAALASPEAEQEAARAADARLSDGAAWLDDASAERRVVLSPSTAVGLGVLAGELDAGLIVFGSEYRTPVGHVAVGRSGETLLENGAAALAFAPAGYATATPRKLTTIGVLPGTADEASLETAYSLAARHDARVTDTALGVDLLIVGSRREAREGHVMVTASAAAAIEQARTPVLVVARGVALSFETLVTV